MSHIKRWAVAFAAFVFTAISFTITGVSAYTLAVAVVSGVAATVSLNQALGSIAFLKRKAQESAQLIFSILGYRSTSVGSLSRPAAF